MNHQKNGDESAPMSDPNGGGNAVAGKKCPSCLAGFSREDIAGNCTCDIEPRTTSPLEQIQKERRIALANLPEEAFLEPFLSESIRIAYEAGQENTPLKNRAAAREVGYQRGYRAGLERAKELVPKSWDQLPTVNENEAVFATTKKILSALDDEIKKNENYPPSTPSSSS